MKRPAMYILLFTLGLSFFSSAAFAGDLKLQTYGGIGREKALLDFAVGEAYQRIGTTTAKTSMADVIKSIKHNHARFGVSFLRAQALAEAVQRLDRGQLNRRVALRLTEGSLAAGRENFAAAEDRIRDIDVAQETAEITRICILQQAGASVLAQANQQPMLAWSLLGQ